MYEYLPGAMICLFFLGLYFATERDHCLGYGGYMGIIASASRLVLFRRTRLFSQTAQQYHIDRSTMSRLG